MDLSKANRDSIWRFWSRRLVVLCAIVFCAGSLVLDRVDSLVLLLVGMIGLAHIVTGRSYFESRLKPVVWTFSLVWIVAVASYTFGLHTQIGFRELGRFFRFAFFAPLAAALLTLDRRQRRWIWLSIPAGMLLCGLVAAYQAYKLPEIARASGQSFPIIFGDLALAGAFFSALAYLPLREDFPRLALPASLLGFLGGMTASFLSGTRGSWLAIPVLTVLLVWLYWRRSGLRRTAAVSFVVVMVVALGILFPADHVLGRIGQAFSELSRYQVARAAIARAGPQVGCLTDREFLVNLARHLSLAGAAEARVEVVAVPGDRTIELRGQACHPRFAIRFANPDVKRGAWLLLKRNLAPELPPSQARILVQGQGSAKPAMGRIAAQRFKSRDLRELAMPRAPSAANILLRVGPGHSMVFIPVATRMGEYSFWYADSSVGARLEMWRAAWQLFVRHPLLGVGTGGFQEAIAALTRDGEIAPIVARFDHPHNEYLAQLSSRGLIGFGTLIVLLWFMVADCRRGLRSPLDEYAAASGCGLVLIAGYGIFGLTETVFTHSLAIAFFVFYSAFFLAVIQVEAGETVGSIESKNELDGDESNDG